MHTLTVPAYALQAALTHTARKDIRTYLCGVRLEPSAGKIIATDGHRMFIGAIDTADAPAVTIPAELLASALKAVKVKKGTITLVTVNYSAGTVELAFPNGARFAGAELEGNYPEWRRVLPQTVSGESAQFNPQYLADAETALKIYYDGGNAFCTTLAPNGTAGGLVFNGGYDPKAVVIVMPRRVVNSTSAPDVLLWLHGSQTNSESVAA